MITREDLEVGTEFKFIGWKYPANYKGKVIYFDRMRITGFDTYLGEEQMHVELHSEKDSFAYYKFGYYVDKVVEQLNEFWDWS